MNKILFCFQQVGGVNALLPLIREWEPRHEMVITGRKNVCDYMRRNNIPGICDYESLGWESGNDLHKNGEWFSRLKPDLVITDTISFSRACDGVACRDFWALAREHGAPSMAYVDCWWAYKQRFMMPNESIIPILPDTIAVVDDIAKSDMKRLGFPGKKIKILGSPLYSTLRRKAQLQGAEQKKMARLHFGMPQDCFLLLFASQQFEGHFGSSEEWGFTEITVFQDMLVCLQSLAPEFKSRLIFNVLLHPEEEGRELTAISHSVRDFPIKFYRGESHRHISASDLVTGMFSILLSEAVILRRPVISIQPNLKREDMLITNMVDATVPVRTHEQFYTHFLRSIMDSEYRRQILNRQTKFRVVTDAYRRWNDEIERLLND